MSMPTASVDDHSRLAYVELHATDTGQAAALTLGRAALWLTRAGLSANRGGHDR